MAELAALEPQRQSFGRAVEMSIALRAVAIFLIVSTHVGLFRISGGAHLLFALAGWNFARFYVDATKSSARRVLTTLSRVAVPAWIMLSLQTAFSSEYDLVSLLLVNNYFNTGLQSYWFIEALLQATIVLTAVLAVPQLQRLERRWPFGFSMALVAVTLVPRWFPFASGGIAVFKTHLILWVFALGWASQRARTLSQRAIVSATILVSALNFTGQPRRDAILAVRRTPCFVGQLCAPSQPRGVGSKAAFCRLALHLPNPLRSVPTAAGISPHLHRCAAVSNERNFGVVSCETGAAWLLVNQASWSVYRHTDD